MKPILLLCLIALSLLGCAPADPCSAPQSGETLTRILFIGNSYTFVNDLPAVFSRLACAGGHKVETGMLAEGGWTLAQHAAAQKTLDTFKSQKWDLVILQEQSEIPTIDYARVNQMYPAVRQLANEIRRMDAQPYLLLTWGHREGLPDAGIQGYFDMQARLDAGYQGIAKELYIPIIPVGDAWRSARNQSVPLDLWQADGSHPNQKGTYLAACVLYASLFQQTPQGVAYLAGLPQDTAQVLQGLAADVALKK